MAQILPVPWINGAHPYHGDWVTFDEGRATRAHAERLCAVCGQPLNAITLLGRGDDNSTFGPGCHPRCMQLTLTACPHFTDSDASIHSNAAVAWRVEGTDLGYELGDAREAFKRVVAGLAEMRARDVQALASVDPWGTGRPDTIDSDDTIADG